MCIWKKNKIVKQEKIVCKIVLNSRKTNIQKTNYYEKKTIKQRRISTTIAEKMIFLYLLHRFKTSFFFFLSGLLIRLLKLKVSTSIEHVHQHRGWVSILKLSTNFGLSTNTEDEHALSVGYYICWPFTCISFCVCSLNYIVYAANLIIRNRT